MAMRLPSLDSINPTEAWQSWQPDSRQPWDLRWAGHLYRRAAFGANLGELRTAVKDGLPTTLDRLLQGDPQAAQYEALLNDTGSAFARSDDAPNLRGWWLYIMLQGGHPLREKLTLFWHNHFATSLAKVRSGTLMFGQNQTLRRHALGKFRPMLADISRDPAMLVWLDSNRNVKGQANENYAREMLELFTLGVGHYTEQDVRETARAFTGWHTDGEKFTFAGRFHDDGDKTVLGQTGAWDGTDVQRLALAQSAAALFIVRKLYAFFVNETEAPPDGLLEPLAERFRTSDYDIADLVATILRSKHFFSEHAYRRRIKSPVEHVLGVVRAVQPMAAPRELVPPLEQMGQSLFAPPNVKGWTGGKTWLNSATVLARQNFAQQMVGRQPRPTGLAAAPISTAPPFVPGAGAPGMMAPPTSSGPDHGLIDLVRREKAETPAAVIDVLTDLLLQGDVDADTRQKLTAFLGEGEPKNAAWEQRVREAAHALMTLPEYALA